MSADLRELGRKIDALTQGLGEARDLLDRLARSGQDDPKQALVTRITQRLGELSTAQLQSVDDYVAFLAAGGPGGGENQPPTTEGGGG